VRPFEESQSCELEYYLVHGKESENAAPVVAFKEWLISEAGVAHPTADVPRADVADISRKKSGLKRLHEGRRSG
jgi:hypothetical protein